MAIDREKHVAVASAPATGRVVEEYDVVKDSDTPAPETKSFGSGGRDRKATGPAEPKEKTLEELAVGKFTAVLEKLGLPKEGVRVVQAFDVLANADAIDTSFEFDGHGKRITHEAGKKEVPVKYEIVLPQSVSGKRMVEVLTAFGLEEATIRGTKTTRGLAIKRNAEKWTITRAEMVKLIEAHFKPRAQALVVAQEPKGLFSVVKHTREGVAREGFEKARLTKMPDNTFVIDNIGKGVDPNVAFFNGAAIAQKENGTDADTQKWTVPADTMKRLAMHYFEATAMTDPKLLAKAVQYINGTSNTREGLEGTTVTPDEKGENFVISGVAAGTKVDNVFGEKFPLVGKPAPDGDWVFQLRKEPLERAVRKPLAAEAEAPLPTEESGIGLAEERPSHAAVLNEAPKQRQLSPAEAAAKAAIDTVTGSNKADVVLANGEYTITLPEGLKAEQLPQVLARLGVAPAAAAAVKPRQKWEKWVFHSMPLLAKALVVGMTDPLAADEAAAATQNRARVAELLKDQASISAHAEEITSLLTTGLQGALSGLADAKLGFDKDGAGHTLVSLRQIAPGTPPTVSFFDKNDLYERETGPDGKPLVTQPTPVMEGDKPKMVRGEPVMEGGGEPVFKTIPVFERDAEGKPTTKKIGEHLVPKTKDGKPVIEIKPSGPLVITIAKKDLKVASSHAAAAPSGVVKAAAKPTGELKPGVWLDKHIFPGVTLEEKSQANGKVSMIVHLPVSEVGPRLTAAGIDAALCGIEEIDGKQSSLTIPEAEFVRAFKVAKATAEKEAGTGGPSAAMGA